MNEATIFTEAIQRADPAERAAYLDAACGEDEALRQRVEMLLAAHEARDSFLDQPVGAATFVAARVAGAEAEAEAGVRADTESGSEVVASPVGAIEGPGSVLGPYRLLQAIGEGGMGTVFMAEQTHPVRRMIAVKVIKAGMDSRQVLARFEAERQALAMMDHPNIAKVLDAGTTSSGRPYFVMELVKGTPISQFCDERRLTLRERIELFIPVCQAVQHAHQKGVIHRDIKPSNVLVALYDGRPSPRVIDFGVAKATGGRLTDRTLFTEFGSVLGTLEYMSPEQAELNQLDIDTRSDIYGLGVLLYELLTGTTPLDRSRLIEASLFEMLRVIREVDPPRPSLRLDTTEELPSIAARRGLEPRRLTGLVRGELDWIVMKALEKDRDRRYETANGLAMDLRRYLADEPVLACPPSAWYRFRKFLRRYRAMLTTAAAFACVLVAATVVSGWLAARAIEAERLAHRNEVRALGERDAKERARREAQQNATKARDAAAAERDAREVAQSRLAQIEKSNLILASIFRDLNPRSEHRGGPTLRIQLGSRLDEVTDLLRKDAVSDPLTVARLKETLGVARRNLGFPKDSILLLEEARATLIELLGEGHHDTLATLSELANAYSEDGRVEDCIRCNQQVLRIREATNGPDHPDTLTSLNNLGVAYVEARRFEQAVPTLQRVLDVRLARLGPGHTDTLISFNNLAQAYEGLGQSEKALPLLERSLQLRTEQLGKDHVLTLTAVHNLGKAYRDAKELDRAMPLLEQALAGRTSVLGPDHPDTLTALDDLGKAYQDAGRLDRALPLLEEAFAARKSKLGPDHPTTLTTANHLGAAYRDTGQLAKALKLQEATLESHRIRQGPDHPLTLNVMNSLALTYTAAGKFDRAIAIHEEVLTARKLKLGADHPNTLASMNNLASAYTKVEQYQKALPLLEQGLELRKVKYGPDHPNTLTSINNLALAYQNLGRAEKALPLLERALDLRQAKLGADHPHTLSSMSNLALAYQELGQVEKALPLLERAYRGSEEKLKPDHPETLLRQKNLALALLDAGRAEGAIELFERAAEGQRAKLGPGHPDTLLTAITLSRAYLRARRPKEAEGRAGAVVEQQRRRLESTRDAAQARAERSRLATYLTIEGECRLRDGRPAEAEAPLREALTLREKAEASASDLSTAQALLGEALADLGRYEEAERHLLPAIEATTAKLSRTPPPTPRTASELRNRRNAAIERLIRAYEAWDKPDQAEAWRNRRDAAHDESPQGKSP